MGAPKDHELVRIELTRTLRLLQRRRGHRTGTDDVVCAWAGRRAAPQARRILDLGSGHGSVALMLAGVLPDAEIVAVEVQQTSFELLCRNVDDNDLSGRIRPVHGDLRQVDLGDERFDLITGSPPFMPVGTGPMPRDPQRAAARFELRGGIEDYCQAASRHLAPNGVVSLLMDASQPDRCLAAFGAAGLHLHSRLAVSPGKGKPPTYLVYRAALSPPDGPEGARELVVRGPDDAWSPQFSEVRRTLNLP